MSKAPLPSGVNGIERVARFAAWVGIIMLAIASWTPGQDMIRTGLNGLLEHVIAYLLTGIAFMYGYRDRSPWAMAVALSFYAGVLEAGQLVAPGRHVGLLDWGAGALGALSAAVLMIAVQWIRAGLRRRQLERVGI